MWYDAAMRPRGYGQFCGFARAAEIIGERWSMLVIRDLFVGQKRFTDLHRGLPGIPTNVLTARLKELEGAGIIRRRILPPPKRSIVYELTEYGLELENVVIAMGRWGAKLLHDPLPGEVVTTDSIIMAMRTTFRPEAARGVRVSYELRMGEIVVNMRIDDGSLEVARGPAHKADLVIEAGPAIKMLMTGELSPADAVRNGSVSLIGKRKLLDTFAAIFRIDPMPEGTPKALA